MNIPSWSDSWTTDRIDKATRRIRSSSKCSYDLKILIVVDKLSPRVVPEAVLTAVIEMAQGHKAKKGSIGASLTTLCDTGYIGREDDGYTLVLP